MRSDLKELDSFTLKTSKNHLIRNFLRNGRLSVKICLISPFKEKLDIAKGNPMNLLVAGNDFSKFVPRNKYFS